MPSGNACRCSNRRHRRPGAPLPSRSVRKLGPPLRCLPVVPEHPFRRPRVNRLSGHRASEVDFGGGIPCSTAGNSLLPNLGNSPSRSPTRGRMRETGPTGKPRTRRISLYFPCRSGISVERQARSRLPPPPFGRRGRRLSARTRAQAEKSPRFRGVLAVEPSQIRTGDCRCRGRMMPDAVFIHVAKFGGSDSLPVRLPKVRIQFSPWLGPAMIAPARPAIAHLRCQLPEGDDDAGFSSPLCPNLVAAHRMSYRHAKERSSGSRRASSMCAQNRQIAEPRQSRPGHPAPRESGPATLLAQPHLLCSCALGGRPVHARVGNIGVEIRLFGASQSGLSSSMRASAMSSRALLSAIGARGARRGGGRKPHALDREEARRSGRPDWHGVGAKIGGR